MFESDDSRRDFLKKTAYVTPLILTMKVSLAEAQAGSSPPVDRVQDLSAAPGDVSTPLDSAQLSYDEKGKAWKDGDEAHEHKGKAYKDKDNNGLHLGWRNHWPDRY